MTESKALGEIIQRYLLQTHRTVSELQDLRGHTGDAIPDLHTALRLSPD